MVTPARSIDSACVRTYEPKAGFQVWGRWRQDEYLHGIILKVCDVEISDLG